MKITSTIGISAMPLDVIHAELDLGTLIYLIAIVLWVIGNVFSKSKKKGNRQRPTPRPDESSAEAELREFLETISGKRQEEEREEAEPPPRRPEPVVVRERQPVRVQRVQRRAEATIVPSRPPLPPIEITEPDFEAVLKEHAKAQGRRSSMGGAFSSALRGSGAHFRIPEVRISILTQAMGSTTPKPPHPTLARRDLVDRKNLRKFVAGSIILGTPKAFEVHDVPEAIRH